MNPIELLFNEFLELITWLAFWLIVFVSGGAVFAFLGVVYYTVRGKNDPRAHKR